MSKFDNLEGGELAASLSSAQRMDLIQKGYNPMSPEDVQRYLKRQKPAEGLHEIAGVSQYKRLGGGVDLAAEDRGLVGGDMRSFAEDADPREVMREKMNNSGNSFGQDLDQRLLSRLSGTFNESPKPKKATENDSYKKATLITEAAKAKNIGYTIGVRYINAFIENIKNPSANSRALVTKEMSNMQQLESKMHSSVLKEYREGIAQAEKDLYSKIKK